MIPFRDSRVEHADTLACLWWHPRSGPGAAARSDFAIASCAFSDRARRRSRGLLQRHLRQGRNPGSADIRWCLADLAQVPVRPRPISGDRPPGDLVARGVFDPNDRALILRYTAGSTGSRRADGGLRSRTGRCRPRPATSEHSWCRCPRPAGWRSGRVASPPIASGSPSGSSGRASGSSRARSSIACGRSTSSRAIWPAWRPSWSTGYPGVLTEIASVWPEVGGQTRDPRLVFLVGEEAFRPAARRRDGFQAAVFSIRQATSSTCWAGSAR